MSQQPQVTIVVVPRERFSRAAHTVHNIYQHTAPPFELIYVSAASPPALQATERQLAERYGFTLLHHAHFLSPNQARNLGLRQVRTKYVVFIDNDALVYPGWLEALVRCAEETAAWVVGPLYLTSGQVHMAGGRLHIRAEGGKRVLIDQHEEAEKPLEEVISGLRRTAVDFVEYHCVLARTSLFERTGPLDEDLKSLHEHIDLGLLVQRAGGTVFMEPAAVASYVAPPPAAWWDLPYFTLRWCEAWNRHTVDHFKRKWGFDALHWFEDAAVEHGEDTILRWARAQRRLLSGLQLPQPWLSQSPLEEAQLQAALFASVDVDAFDLEFVDAAGHVVERFDGLQAPDLYGLLPQALQRSGAVLRPRPQTRPHAPRIVCLQMDQILPDAFAVLQTGPARFQNWLAIVRHEASPTSPAMPLAGAHASLVAGTAGRVVARHLLESGLLAAV